ncbi:uncharacterized protein LOC113334179 isoform X1 [Papaver somniferum]|uniref:uncharacterized protein LOC113334179 isoform X1 n=1 Tax=Papaver somniferum TaxID=3469 RepID=UPI000E705612|nr:uncharacterized protein LOC113334179 isoform X1 [Papaver somniferum]
MNINGVSSPKTHFFPSILPQNPILLPLKPINVIKFISSTTNSISSSNSSSVSMDSPSSSSYVVSYLMNSCGLSKDKAISTSAKINFRTTSEPDAVLDLLQSYGFTKSHISNLITKNPSCLLLSNPNKTLKPKLDYLNSKGFSGVELAKVLSFNPYILGRGLNEIVNFFDALKNILQTDDNVAAALRRCSMVYQLDLDIKLMLNIGVLRNEGLAECDICKLFIRQPRVLSISNVRFKEVIAEVMGMGFNPLETSFILAVEAFAVNSKSTWEAKVNAYKRLGWSDEEFRIAFLKQPQCMRVSEKQITLVGDFLVNEMGYSPSVIAKRPRIFCSSLKNRIIPRCSVIRILVSKGLVKNLISPSSLATLTETSFLSKFVFKYEKEAPELFEVYQVISEPTSLQVNQPVGTEDA